MLVSGVIAAASLIGILVALFGVAVVLTYIENKLNKNRIH